MNEQFKPRLLHVIDSLAVGGAERLLVNIINRFEDAEHHLICLSDKLDLKKYLESDCRISSLHFTGKKSIFRSVNFIARYIRQNHIDIVHSHLVMSNIMARMATPSRIPLFNSLHNLNGLKFFKKRYSWQSLVERATYKKRHHLIAVSEAVLEDYRQTIGIKGEATVLHNFVEDRFFASMPHVYRPGGKLRMVAVGSLKAQKNYEFLIDAFSGLPSVSLDIYGEGPLKEELEKRIIHSNAAVRLCGNNPAIETVLRNYDLYVMGSLYEGHPIALLEAMAAGMPTLVADIPVLKEATGGHNFFFKAGSREDFRYQVLRVLDNKININELAAFNLSFAHTHARKEVYFRKLKTLYSNAIHQAPNSPKPIQA